MTPEQAIQPLIEQIKTMSDRINTITVVLEKDVRDDDCEAVLNAMRMIKGVLRATPNVASVSDHMAEERAKHHLGQKLIALIYPPLGPTP